MNTTRTTTTGPTTTAENINERLVVIIGQQHSLITSGRDNELPGLAQELGVSVEDLRESIENHGNIFCHTPRNGPAIAQLADDYQHCSESQLVAYARGIVSDPNDYVVEAPALAPTEGAPS